MTRGDFILSILSSLIATILLELTRKIYPRLQISLIIRLSKGLFRVFAIPKLSARVLPYSIVLVLSISVGVNMSVRTVFAPTDELKVMRSLFNSKCIDSFAALK